MILTTYQISEQVTASYTNHQINTMTINPDIRESSLSDMESRV